ncbi:histidine phosphatase family protein [Candidatus Woesearchaeota archaeon]|nr:histidine phosphatase family protein [Candidatus Woesearchaeota archaeon]
MLDLILLRHAQSTGNKAGLFQGQVDMDPINPEFPDTLLIDITAIGEVSALYTTDLKRGRMPAEDLSRKLKELYGKPIIYESTPLLRERNLGELEGKPYATISEDFDKVVHYTYMTETIAGGESRQQLQQRAAKVRELYIADKQGIVVIISHGVFLKYLLDNLENTTDVKRTLENLKGYHVTLDNNTLQQLCQFPTK